MKKTFVHAAVAFGILSFASCLKENDGTTNPTQSALMVANYSPDASSLYVTLNSKSYISGLSYGYLAGYSLVTAGTYDAGIASSSSSILSDSITLEANKYYSYFIIDSLASLTYAFFEDNLVEPSSDSVYVRFLHFSPDAGTINFRDSATENYFSKSRTFNDQEATTAYTAFTRMAADTITFQLINADSAIIASQKDTLVGGHIYTILAKGFLNGTASDTLAVGTIQNY
ncbi:DUF4397 domain-containing protein [Parafilimonas sp.]|uniref:DUF4397 domain-containing protein n=1 Tax=Parafilimonas sp. TaxID=1969739 RepID=UPI0039E41D8E